MFNISPVHIGVAVTVSVPGSGSEYNMSDKDEEDGSGDGRFSDTPLHDEAQLPKKRKKSTANSEKHGHAGQQKVKKSRLADAEPEHQQTPTTKRVPTVLFATLHGEHCHFKIASSASGAGPTMRRLLPIVGVLPLERAPWQVNGTAAGVQ
jgi:hypothetical protein